mgnify:CR=1 FL=1
MRGQVFCRVGARTRATDLLGPDDTVGELRTRILGDAVTQLPGADDVVRPILFARISTLRSLAPNPKRRADHPDPSPTPSRSTWCTKDDGF